MIHKTIREAYYMASSFLKKAAHSDSQFEAELFLRFLVKFDRAQFFSRLDETISPLHYHELHKMLERRVSGEPVQYILGGTEFYGRFFFVNSSVLIPRPETEILIERTLLETQSLWDRPVHVVEVGTGSGIIAVTLCLEQPEWCVTAIDISTKAMDVAKKNAALHGVQERITWVESDYLGNIVEEFPMDVLVSNPPYIPSHTVMSLDPEVKDFEPRCALDGGEDGLHPYREIMRQLRTRTKLPQVVCFEIGAEQGVDVTSIIKGAFNKANVTVCKDLAGRDRVVIGKNLRN